MRNPSSLLFLILAASCGRTPIENEAEPKPPVNEAPLFVFTGSNCPSTGSEADLTPGEYEGLALVRFRALDECSGAGGQWLVGSEVGSSRGLFVGSHTCSFFPEPLRDSTGTRFGVVRFSQTAALFQAPHGWCITDEDGGTASTDAKSLAWGVYATEAGARAAYERLDQSR
jgi:hypothetical protein